MVFDELKNCGIYEPLNKNLSKAFEFLRQFEANPLDVGRVDIDGNTVFALVQAYESMPAEQRGWESHRQYIDVQYVSRGREAIGWARMGALVQNGEYQKDKDLCCYEDGPATLLRCEAGTFAVFFPEDVHKPGCALDGSAAVKKVVVKIKI